MKPRIRLLLFTLTLGLLPSHQAGAAEEVSVPFRLAKGQMLYERYCSQCHGARLDGSDRGPPLVHPFYKPSHHGDGAFYRAVLKGTRQHHWNFGDMPPVAGMTQKKMDALLPFIRHYQQQKGLFQRRTDDE